MSLAAVPTANEGKSTDQEEAIHFLRKMKNKLGKYLCSRADATSQTNLRIPMKTKIRAVLYMAFGYAGSWLLVWAPFFVQIVFLIVTKSYNDTVLIVT